MEVLYLKWKDGKTNKKFVIGALGYDREKQTYYFRINKSSIEKAKKYGYIDGFLPFPNEEKVIKAEKLWSFFDRRIPNIEDMDEENQKEILEEYGLDKFDKFDFLKKTKGFSMTDNFSLEES